MAELPKGELLCKCQLSTDMHTEPNPLRILIPLLVIFLCVFGIIAILKSGPMQSGDFVRHRMSGEKGQVIRSLLWGYREVRFYSPSRGLYEQDMKVQEIEPWESPK